MRVSHQDDHYKYCINETPTPSRASLVHCYLPQYILTPYICICSYIWTRENPFMLHLFAIFGLGLMLVYFFPHIRSINNFSNFHSCGFKNRYSLIYARIKEMFKTKKNKFTSKSVKAYRKAQRRSHTNQPTRRLQAVG